MFGSRNKNVITNGDTTFYQFDHKMGFWGVPNLEKEVCFQQLPEVPVRVKHNSHGNRDENIELKKNERTIVCFGGSHTWGGAVDQEARYTNRLGKMIGRKVVNMGHCSLGLDQVCLAILQKSSEFKPEIIVIEQYPWAVHRVLNNYVNGYVRPHFVLDHKGKLQLHKVSSFAKIPLFRNIIGSFFAFRKEFIEFKSGINLKNTSGDNFVDPIFVSWKTRHYDYMYDLIDKILMVIRDYCYQHKIKLLFGLGAIQQQFGPESKSKLLDYDLPRKRLIELLEKNKVNYVDMTDPMLEEHTKSDPVIYDDGHINAKGHDVFAKILHKEFIKLNWIAK
jgi:hypothetical protein